MVATAQVGLLALLLSSSQFVLGRERWLERDNKPILLHPRRFGQEQGGGLIAQIGSACNGAICGNLAGAAVAPLLANAPECSQQDQADAMIDAAAQLDATEAANLIALAVKYRQLEKNTPPDFTTNPPTNRNSVFCQTAPKNAQLNGLVQAQDPANDPNLFFDPATKQTVKKGQQANTFPFGTAPTNLTNAGGAADAATPAPAVDAVVATSVNAAAASTDCVATVTVTASGAALASPTGAVTVSVGNTGSSSSTSGSSGIGNFGSCSVPQIEFGVGFDNRKETSFQPVDQKSFPHGSAQNIDIIIQAICDDLTNTCKADDTAKATCAKAQAAADAQPPKQGGQADAFNAVFDIQTDFAAIPARDDQGNIIAGSTVGGDAAASGTSNTGSAATSAANTATETAAAALATGDAGGIGNFGICSVPEIEFGVGFDGRKETSFRPTDPVSYDHGSADDGNIIAQFECDTLVNKCKADATAVATCAKAKADFQKGAPKTGQQADFFNAAFGKVTNFAAIAPVDNQGNVVQTAAAASTTATTATTAAATKATAAATTAASTGNLQKFTGALGSVAAPAVTAIGNGQFQVDGNSAFNNLQDALVRSCDVQQNKCANQANATGNKGDLTVAACGDQQTQCDAQANS